MNIKKMNNKLLLIILGLLLTNCSKYLNDEDILLIKSEIVSCEEQNVHFKILSIDDSKKQSLVGTFVLPVCQDETCRKEIYSVSQLDTNRIFKVRGCFSLKGHKKVEYGCIGAYKFKTIECKEVFK
jgi:hypothetical protein